jgi:hypothetical protein
MHDDSHAGAGAPGGSTSRVGPQLRRTTPSIESMDRAAREAREKGHVLAGFARRSDARGYRFVTRCRSCALVVTVERNGAGWWYASPLPGCPGVMEPRSGRPEAGRAPERPPR